MSPGRTIAAPVELLRVALDCRLAPARVLLALAPEPLAFALVGAWAGGGAIVGSDPLRVAGDGEDPFALLDDLPMVAASRGGEGAGHDGGAVGGGWFGWLGYRLAARVERVPLAPDRPVALPDFHLAYYDNVLRQDPDGRWWFEALRSDARRDAIAARLARVRALLARAERSLRHAGPATLTLSAGDAAHHLDAVADCRRRIARGEIFQANICLRVDGRCADSPAQLLDAALERVSPPFAAAFDTPRGGLVSLSPELFLRRRGRLIVTAPIKGTIARALDPDAATAALARLTGSAKDASEHVMIVDLMRNDLGRVCEYGTIKAPRLPSAEPHPGLWHLVSHVRGRLRAGVGDAQLLRATFPPGSVTGAPKVQSLKVIAALERAGREVYTGAIGFASPVAGLALSVAIRTLELGAGRIWLGAGGGIVADSDPRRELDEALTKARPIAAAIGASLLVAPPSARAPRRPHAHSPA